MKIDFSKIILIVLWAWHIIFTIIMLYIFWHKGSTPVEVYVCETGPLIAELILLTRLKIDKRKYERDVVDSVDETTK